MCLLNLSGHSCYGTESVELVNKWGQTGMQSHLTDGWFNTTTKVEMASVMTSYTYLIVMPVGIVSES